MYFSVAHVNAAEKVELGIEEVNYSPWLLGLDIMFHMLRRWFANKRS